MERLPEAGYAHKSPRRGEVQQVILRSSLANSLGNSRYCCPKEERRLLASGQYKLSISTNDRYYCFAQQSICVENNESQGRRLD